MFSSRSMSQLHLDLAPHDVPALAVPPALAGFHRALREWFVETLGAPTEPQVRSWPEIQAGHDVLIAAPTGSGKTLSAFFSCLDRLFRLAVDQQLEGRTYVVYVSPLRAL